MASFGSDEEIVKTREGYMKAEKKLYEYHLLAAEQAGATNEIKEIRIMLNVLAPK